MAGMDIDPLEEVRRATSELSLARQELLATRLMMQELIKESRQISRSLRWKSWAQTSATFFLGVCMTVLVHAVL